ncbi:MAG: CaiB/BaiF CoA transferase family protein [Hyphomonadaceae bacterium]
MSDPTQILTGLRVIELGHSVAAPVCAQALGDLGAEVIKIENPGKGDDARSWAPPFWEGTSATFQSVNRNKASVCLDLKDEKQRDWLRALARESDVFVQNMRPGLVERYGLDAPALRTENPRLIYCNVRAYGDAGPLADKPGYDPLIQAFSGVMSTTGEPGRAPVRTGPSVIDIGTGMWAAIGVLAALLRRKETGEGAVIDVSLLETALAMMALPIANTMASGRDPGPSGTETPMLAPYRAFRAQDNFIVIAAGNDNLFRKLCGVLGRPEWPEDARYRTNPERVANRVALNAAIQDIIATHTAAYWTDALNAADVPCAPVQSVNAAINHPQTQATGAIGDTPDGKLRLVRTPLKLNGVRPPIRSAPPALGADTKRFLGEGEPR